MEQNSKVLFTCICIILSNFIQRKIHQIGIAFRHISIDFLSCSHITRYDSYPDKLYVDRPPVHAYPSLSYPGRLFTRFSSENSSLDRFVLHFQRQIDIIQIMKKNCECKAYPHKVCPDRNSIRLSVGGA